MTPPVALLEREAPTSAPHETNWALRALLLWRHRKTLVRVTACALIAGLAISFSIPKQYKSTASIAPPDEQHSSAMILAALASHSTGLGALGGLAGGLIGGHTTTELFIDLLRSGTVSGHLIDRFDLQKVYHNRYRVDAAKHLARLTKITENKKSGVITIEVEDTDRVRARDLAQAYLDELNNIVFRTNTSSAHLERVFIEQRLKAVQSDLEQAQVKLGDFSSKNTTIDIREQTRAMVDAGARVQAQLLVEQAGLQSLRQIYGDQNVRVRESEARIASLKSELAKMTGSSTPAAIQDDPSATTDATTGSTTGDLYPSLRQLPHLAVPYADLYRRVRVQETLYELLTQQYEMARIEEAKDVPAVSVIDAPGIAEKKSFPPRLLLSLAIAFLAFAFTSALILMREHWSTVDERDPRKELAAEVLPVLRSRLQRLVPSKRGRE